MNEERKMILQMVSEGTITVEEAEQLLEALSASEEAKPNRGGKDTAGGVYPKIFQVHVTEGGRVKFDIRLPFSIMRTGLKLGRSFGFHAGYYGADEAVFDAVRSLDIEEILENIRTGATQLPYVVLDADLSDHDQHVKVTLE